MKDIQKVRIGGHKYVKPSNIRKLIACENYTNIEFRSGKRLMVATTLGILLERLEPYGFIRPNRQTVVNMKDIRKVKEIKNGYTIRLKNSDEMKISNRRVKSILSLLDFIP